MLAGACTLTQGGRSFDEAAGSVAVINPNRPFAKKMSSTGRQLLVRIERRLLDRELQAWTGREPKELIEFDQSGAFAVEKVPTLTHAVRMLCDDLRDESSSLDHPLVRRRIASTLASALLVGLPHNYSRAFEAGESSIAPASMRRAEGFIEENAMNAIGSPMWLQPRGSAHGRCRRPSVTSATRPRWRILRAAARPGAQRIARGSDGGSVTSVAIAHGFGSPQPVCGRLQSPLPRSAFRKRQPRRRTLSQRGRRGFAYIAICMCFN